MSHPLAAELEEHESLDSSCRNGGYSQTWTQTMGSSEWSDVEEWKGKWKKREGKLLPSGDLNIVLMIFEVLLVILTLISPILIYTVPILWEKHLYGVSEATRGCRVLCEIRLLSLCVRYAVLCTVITVLYAIRLRSAICCTARLHTSSTWLQSTKNNTELVKSKAALSLSESDRQNFLIYLFLDFLMAVVTFVFWIHLITKWNFQVTHMMRPGKQRTFTAKNPFVQSDIGEDLENVATNIALSDSGTFVNAHLFIQIAGALFIKAWETSCGDQLFLVHVIRAPDSFSHTYRIGLVDVHTAAVLVIQNLSIEPRVNDPLTANKRRRNENSRCTTQTERMNDEQTNLDDCPISPTKSDTTKRGARRRQRHADFRCREFDNSEERVEHEECSRNMNQTESNPATSDVGPSETSIRISTPYLGTIDQRELNSAAATRMNLQADYDFLLLKRQIRLKLLVEHWFQVVQKKDKFIFDKGPNSVQLGRLLEATDLVYEHIEHPLFRYLRFTGQHGRHSESSIREHLTLHLACRMTADSFLSPYFQPHPQLIRDPQPGLGCADFSTNRVHLAARCRPSNGQCEITDTYFLKESRSRSTRLQKTFRQMFQTWKLRIRRNALIHHKQSSLRIISRKFSINSFIHHGLQFELLRADVTLLCTVYRVPTFQLDPTALLRPDWFGWARPEPEDPSMPTSTIETCLGSSENFMEIRL
ncbi:hypothetical protein D915_000842 [Fasciola hepatica]|uniref:Uncharacterized protein n=1 Tax=Fasciola hepatica TaxID=6192 RepID=A0A4E0RJB7_FASHE|nr:hypothetical protein D915_000842 [Fasciola hepatica]